MSEIELPMSLKLSLKRNYVPQLNHLEGYSHMPRPVAPPYSNLKMRLQHDFVKKKRSLKANDIMKRVSNMSVGKTE